MSDMFKERHIGGSTNTGVGDKEELSFVLDWGGYCTKAKNVDTPAIFHCGRDKAAYTCMVAGVQGNVGIRIKTFKSEDCLLQVFSGMLLPNVLPG